MSAMASQITNLTIVHSTVCSRRRSKKTSKPRVTGLCERNSPHKGPVTRKTFPFDDVIMWWFTFSRPPWSHTCQVSDINCPLISNRIVVHSDAIGASSTLLQVHLYYRINTWHQWIGQRQLQDETRNISVWEFGIGTGMIFMINHSKYVQCTLAIMYDSIFLGGKYRWQ